MLVILRVRRRADNDSLASKDEQTFSSRGQISPDEIENCKAEDGSDWLLGSGSFGQVYKGLRRGVQAVAVKKLNCTTSPDAWLRLLVKEVNVLKEVSYDRNIVQFYGACLEDQATAMLVMEYMAVRFWHLPVPRSCLCAVLVCLACAGSGEDEGQCAFAICVQDTNVVLMLLPLCW